MVERRPPSTQDRREPADEGRPSRPNRRDLLQGTVALLGGALASRGGAAGAPAATATALRDDDEAGWSADPTLRSLADVVLPRGELGDEGVARTLVRFADWVEGFEPVAELDHRYLSTDEIPYGPPDPRPLWTAQLEALELESQKRHLVSFPEVPPTQRREMVERAIDASQPRSRDGAAGLPSPQEANHVAVALMAWFFGSSDANDLCHQRRIGRHECRGMAGVDREPRPLPNPSGGAR